MRRVLEEALQWDQLDGLLHRFASSRGLPKEALLLLLLHFLIEGKPLPSDTHAQRSQVVDLSTFPDFNANLTTPKK